MGVWAWPGKRKKQFENLKALMAEPLLTGANHLDDDSADSLLYNTFGDDQLFDDMNDLRKKYGHNVDVRDAICMRLIEILDKYQLNNDKYDDRLKELAYHTLNELINKNCQTYKETHI